jgi:hypothetical protein
MLAHQTLPIELTPLDEKDFEPFRSFTVGDEGRTDGPRTELPDPL